MVVGNTALCMVNFKSCDCTAVQAVLFWDLKNEPKCGCAEISLFVPDTSSSPIWDIQTLYSKLCVITTIQYSTPSWRYTGESNVNVVMAVPVVASIFTSFDSFTTLPKGRTLGPGYPLSVFLISIQVGRVGSFCA